VVAWDLHTADKHKPEAYDDCSQCLIARLCSFLNFLPASVLCGWAMSLEKQPHQSVLSEEIIIH
jgi:hypothetical protein